MSRLKFVRQGSILSGGSGRPDNFFERQGSVNERFGVVGCVLGLKHSCERVCTHL